MKSKIAYEIHKPARKNFVRRSFKVLGINETLQIDLIDMQKYAKENSGNNYILTVIDTFSKKAWAVPLKNKSGLVVTEAIKTILPNGVKNIQSDNGKEFFNKYFSSLMKKL
ncbi:integrase catalytic domain-containing protein, partial [Vibrio cholerae]|uniref:integrase catalytic domain-containing protein n=1 Tax=Vibrio cholerae TaxID=666 RepID=UPI000A24FCBD